MKRRWQSRPFPQSSRVMSNGEKRLEGEEGRETTEEIRGESSEGDHGGGRLFLLLLRRRHLQQLYPFIFGPRALLRLAHRGLSLRHVTQLYWLMASQL